jgi:hypothetical protein
VPVALVLVATWWATVDRLLVDTPHVERLTFVNPTPYDIGVEITDADRSGWLGLGDAEDRAVTSFQEVFDQGEVWIVRLADGEAGELRVTRANLEHVGWHIHIPAETEARLRPAWGPPEQLAD